MFKELVASLLLSGSIGAKSVVPVTVPLHSFADSVDVDRQSLTVFGNYNFRDYIEFDNTLTENYTLVFEDTSSLEYYLNLVPIHCGDEIYSIWYCESIDFYVSGSDLEIRFNCYNYSNSHYVIEYNLESGDYITDYEEPLLFDLIFNVRQQYYLHGRQAYLFNQIFTSGDNTYTKTYTGYFNFNNGISSFPSQFVTFGSFIFNQHTYNLMFNYGDGVHGLTSSGIYLGYYQVVDENGNGFNGFSIESISVPFNTQTMTVSNIYMTGVKMSQTSYLRLSNVGVFTYVRDTTYDNAGFRDLLFGIVDTPIYFVSSILSFELFGVNLFIALTGLLTLMVILVLIKKFW